jgi:hypothetical protein
MKSFLKEGLGALAGAGTTALLTNILAPSDKSIQQPLQNFQNTAGNFSGGGLNSTRMGNRVTVAGSQQRNNLVQKAGKSFNEQSREFADLRKKVKPGQGLLTKAAVSAIDNHRLSSVSDLRDNFARRRIQGSSFASDAISRAEAEFTQKESEVRANAYAQEFQLQAQLIEAQYNSARQAHAVSLDELNLQGDAALQLASNGQAILANVAAIQSGILKQSAQNQGAVFQPAIKTISDQLSDFTRGLFT